MTDERLVRGIVVAFDDLADPHTPDYLEAAIEHASSRPQRPVWTFPGRWFPLEVTTRPVPTPALPWRQIGAFALIALLIVAALAVYVDRDPRLPEPFGLAANGLIAFVDEGDIYVSNSIDASPQLVIGGSAVDREVQVSRDGRLNSVPPRTGRWPAPPDRGNRWCKCPSAHPARSTTSRADSWSPDGSAIAIAREVGEYAVISIVATDGSGAEVDARHRGQFP